MCRRKFAEKEAAVLKRSFSKRPPDFNLTLRLSDRDLTSDSLMAKYLRTLTQKFRDYRKREGATLEYYISIEFSQQKPHCHLTIITSVDVTKNTIKELIKGWWAMSCPGRSTAVYCDRVRNIIGLANYLPKNIKDRSKVEIPPQMWRGRRCRFIWRSRGFLIKSKETLWREQCAEWFPRPATSIHLNDEKDNDKGTANRPARCVAGFWCPKQPLVRLRQFQPLAAASPAFQWHIPTLSGVRPVTMVRGP